MIHSAEIQTILKQFYKISGFRVSIHDVEYHEIYAYPQSPCTYCACLQREENVLQSCRQSDNKALSKVAETGKPYVYICPNYLYEIVAPIYNYGVLAGYLVMGQVAAESEESRIQLQKNAAQKLKNPVAAARLVNTLKFIDPKLLQPYVDIMTLVAGYITENHLINSAGISMPVLVKEYLDKNYSVKISIDRLSHKFECSRSTVQKGFYKMYGCSVMTYLKTIRLEQAQKMLLDGTGSIGQVASSCGFEDQNYFSRIFAQEFGCSPTAYRNRGIQKR